jgi:hypothetical protein
MYVVAQHAIIDSAKFFAGAQVGMSNIPAELKLLKFFPSADGTKAMCLWEAGKVDQVKRFVDGLLGHVSTNDFYEVEGKNAVGLP